MPHIGTNTIEAKNWEILKSTIMKIAKKSIWALSDPLNGQKLGKSQNLRSTCSSNGCGKADLAKTHKIRNGGLKTWIILDFYKICQKPMHGAQIGFEA